MNLSGYFHIRINILEFLSFSNLDNEYADNKVITINIPLTNDIFKINVNNIDDVDSYYDFSKDGTMNILFLIIGAFCLSVMVSLMSLNTVAQRLKPFVLTMSSVKSPRLRFIPL